MTLALVAAVSALLSLYLAFVLRRRLDLRKRAIPTKASTLLTSLGEVAYRVRGQGPVMVFVHGIGASQAVWEPTTRALEHSFLTVAIDLLGFGDSSRPVEIPLSSQNQAQAIWEIVDQIAPSAPVQLVASSMGGVIALKMAEMRSQQVQSLTLISPAIGRKFGRWYHLAKGAQLLLPIVNSWVLKWILRRVRPKAALGPEEVARYLAPFLNDHRDLFCFLEATRALASSSHHNQWKGWGPKTLFLWGSEDLILRPLSDLEVQRLLPGARLITRDGGHHLMEDHPAWVAQTILDWVKRQSHDK